MSHCEEGSTRTRNSVWAISFFRDTRKPSQQNVLQKIVLQNDTAEEETLAYEDKNRSFWIQLVQIINATISKENRLKNFGILGMVLAFSVSFTVSYILLMTNWYGEQILKALIIKNNTIIFDYWREPPVKPLITVYIFNYTNAEEALKGKEKPKVEEIGPFTFRETMERVNIHFHSNGTISFQEKRTHEFIKEMSASLNQIIVTPNLPLITAVAFSKSSYILTRFGLTILMKSFDIKPFQKVTANEFIWGADDSFTNVASKVAELLGREVPSGFGVLSSRIGVSPDVVTIQTGATDFDKFGVITHFNGQEKLDAWKSECNRLDGGDGTLYPPRLIGSTDQVYVYAKEFCRRMPLKFHKRIKTADGFPAMRYVNPSNIFSAPLNNPDNSCFCTNNDCAPDGLQNTEPCSYGAPIFMSFPHFLRADPKLHSHVFGLIPDENKHTTHIDIHETLGIPIGGVSRLQINIRIVKPPHFSPLDELDDGIFLPVAWLQCSIGRLPTSLSRILFHVTYSLKLLEYFLIFSSVFSTLFFIFLLMKKRAT